MESALSRGEIATLTPLRASLSSRLFVAKKFTWPLGVFARQQLTLKGTVKENWAELARAARASGDIADAAEFAAKAGDETLLHELEREAVESGDLFNYQSVRRVRGLEAE